MVVHRTRHDLDRLGHLDLSPAYRTSDQIAELRTPGVPLPDVYG